MTSFISADQTWVLFAILTAIAALSIQLEHNYKWASRVTGCVLALIGAMILSNLNVIPLDAPAYDFVWSYVVPLAIPLLLFNANIRRIWKDSGRLLIIYLISGIGTILGAFIGYFLLKDLIKDLGIAVTMMIGTYTGGSVNLVAMADAYKAPADLVPSSVVADNLLMALYFFALIAASGSRFFLKRYKHPLIDAVAARSEGEQGAASYWVAKPVALKDIASSVALSFVIVALSTVIAGCFSDAIAKDSFAKVLINGLLGNKYLIMTTVTVLIATAFPGSVGSIAGAQEIGTFLIHIFFTVIGVPASIRLIVTQAPLLLIFCTIIVATNMIVSFSAGKLFGFTLEEIIIASNANVGGPTTAAAMAISRGWTELIVPAILVGTLGYVLGNYYGVFAGTCLEL